jgi:hypothetical protein
MSDVDIDTDIDTEPVPKRKARKVIDRDLTRDEYGTIFVILHWNEVPEEPEPVAPGSPEDRLMRALFGDEEMDWSIRNRGLTWGERVVARIRDELYGPDDEQA